MSFIFGFLCGLVAAGVLIAIVAQHQQYIQFGKGERADKVDDDFKDAVK